MIKDKYDHGFYDGIDAHWEWVQASVYYLVKLGVLPEETNALIYEKIANMTIEEFNRYMSEIYEE